MSLPQAPRRGGGAPRRLHFSYLKIAKGEKVLGYLAGPVMWFEMHTSDVGSKPCLEAMTGGELKCPKCKFGPAATKGACGFYHAADYKPYMVWLDEGKRDEYDRFGIFRRVMLAREKIKGAPVWMEQCLNQEPVFASTLPERQRPADLTCSLLRMWQMPELDLWYSHTHGASDTPVSLPTGKTQDEYLKEVTTAILEGDHASAESFAGALVGPAAAEVLRRRNEQFAQRAKDAANRNQRNGRHKPPG